MPASNKQAQAAFEILGYIRRAIKEQLVRLTAHQVAWHVPFRTMLMFSPYPTWAESSCD